MAGCAPAIGKNYLDGLMWEILPGDFDRVSGMIRRHPHDYFGLARFCSVKYHPYLHLYAGLSIRLAAVPVCPYALNFHRPKGNSRYSNDGREIQTLALRARCDP